MNSTVVLVGLLAGGSARAQTRPNLRDYDLPGLTTPAVLAPRHSEFRLQANAFGGADKVTRMGISYFLGLGRGWEVQAAGTFAKESSLQLADGGDIDFGGSTAEALLKYRLPGLMGASIQGGVGYLHTPAQLDRPVTLLGASFGEAIGERIRLFANPRLVALDNNSLIAVALGAVVNLTRRMVLFAEATLVLNGDNAISDVDGSRRRDQLHAFGLRFPDVLPRTSLDLGCTNMIGGTIAFSLTPSYGDVGGLYAAVDLRF